MDNSIIHYLEQLELSEFEAKLYLKILEIDPKTVRELSQLLEINRTTAYLYIERLIEKELVSKIIKGGKVLIVPNNPKDVLHTLVDNKVISVNAMQKNLSNITDALTEKYSIPENTDEAEVKYYKGKLGVKKIYEDALKTKELRSYSNFINGITLAEVETKFFEAFKTNPDLIMYELLGDTPTSRKQPLLHNKRYFRKYIPNIVKLSTTDILIYDGKVCIINLDTIPVGTVLRNNDYFIHTKGMFDYFWETLPIS